MGDRKAKIVSAGGGFAGLYATDDMRRHKRPPFLSLR